MSCCVSSHYRFYGTFFYKQIGSIRFIVFYPLQILKCFIFWMRLPKIQINIYITIYNVRNCRHFNLNNVIIYIRD
ncbi:hypothetical protein DXC09_06475 [Streptococcus vestibularis]|nr:hypothetical protein DXC09_06475 [Streptococcus vestibularis]